MNPPKRKPANGRLFHWILTQSLYFDCPAAANRRGGAHIDKLVFGTLRSKEAGGGTGSEKQFHFKSPSMLFDFEVGQLFIDDYFVNFKFDHNHLTLPLTSLINHHNSNYTLFFERVNCFLLTRFMLPLFSVERLQQKRVRPSNFASSRRS